MISLMDPLCYFIKSGDDVFEIETDFRAWVAFEITLSDTKKTNEQKFFEIIQRYKNKAPQDAQKAIDGLLWFYQGGESKDQKPENKPSPVASPIRKQGSAIYDFEQDAGLIYAAFRQAYNIDLLRTDYLHWWTFRALFLALPGNTKLVEVMGIRATKLDGLSDAEKQRIRELQKLYQLKKDEQPQMTMEERKQSIQEYARQRLGQMQP